MSNCPNCTAPLLGDEKFCLQCGTRLVAEPPPKPSYTLPAVIVAAIALLAVGGVVFALEQVESDAEREATKPTAVIKRTPPATETTADAEPPAEVGAWPEDTAAYTVVLTQSPDEGAVRARATAAASDGVPAGVLDSDLYPTLDPGVWVLFTGSYDTQAEAADEATRYAASGFPDARAAFVSAPES
ncbi:MAG TPA: zinc ribbon domain-containing protein [Thermoleophilaceae bacterium]|nr:zinc ribbon domain-containing protein [Thermoleophilaceae bacterium]